MMKGSEVRKADHPIESLLLDRWSPRAMSGEEISDEELMRLFELARWAPSSFNAQQWCALYARRGAEHWQTFFNLLVDANKAWAKNAAVLVVFISRKIFDYNDEPSATQSYHTGADRWTHRDDAVPNKNDQSDYLLISKALWPPTSGIERSGIWANTKPVRSIRRCQM